MSSLTTLFNVGPEEYVEFNESLGSKAFLEHVWDQETTPLKQGDTADSRLRSAGARLSSSDPPCIEFPTITRIKGQGNSYRLTGRWISWQDLQRKHPLAVCDPPDIAEFQRRGAKVGEGEKLGAGEWLTEESLTSKAAKRGGGAGAKQESRGNATRGSSQSKYAPKVAAAAESPLVERNAIVAATPALPQSNGFAGPSSSSSSLLGRFTTPAADEEDTTEGEDKPGPKSPKTPARTRPAALQLDLESTPTHMRPFKLPLVSPSTTRTPLSATHPLPETPLKHTSALPRQQQAPVAQPNSARQALAERRSRPSVPPLSPSSRADAEAEEATRGLGLGLGLTPTRPTAYVGLGAALSPVQQRRMDLPTIPSATDEGESEGDDGGASSHETVKATSPPVEPAHRDEAVDEIESMLLRLRKAKSGLASAAGSSASRWASPAASAAPAAESAAPRSDAAGASSMGAEVSGAEQQRQAREPLPSTASPELSVNGKVETAGEDGRKERKTKKDKKEKNDKSAKAAAPSAAASAPPPPTPHLSSGEEGWTAAKSPAAPLPPTPTAPRAMRQKAGEATRSDVRAKGAKEATLAAPAPATEPNASALKSASPPTEASAPRETKPPPASSPPPPQRPATPPAAAFASDAEQQQPQTPAMAFSAAALASPLLSLPSPSTPSHRDLDWAADDDEDDDELPDLGDWGVVLPKSGSAASVSADRAPQPQPQASNAQTRAQPKAPAPPAQRELFPTGAAKGARGPAGRAVSSGQAIHQSSSASSSEYAAWRRGERASSAKPAALPASSSRELFPSSSPAHNGAAASLAWPRHQQAAQAAPSPADGDWKAARTATLAAEEKREKKAAAAPKSKGKHAPHSTASAPAPAPVRKGGPKRAPSEAPSAAPAQGLQIAGIASRSASATSAKVDKDIAPPPMAASPPKGPKADRGVHKKAGGGGGGGAAGNKKKKEVAASNGGDGGK